MVRKNGLPVKNTQTLLCFDTGSRYILRNEYTAYEHMLPNTHPYYCVARLIKKAFDLA